MIPLYMFRAQGQRNRGEYTLVLIKAKNPEQAWEIIERFTGDRSWHLTRIGSMNSTVGIALEGYDHSIANDSNTQLYKENDDGSSSTSS